MVGRELPGGVTELLFGQIAAIGTRIRRQFLFIKRLRGIQNLLRGHAELRGRNLLKGGKAVGEREGLFFFSRVTEVLIPFFPRAASIMP